MNLSFEKQQWAGRNGLDSEKQSEALWVLVVISGREVAGDSLCSVSDSCCCFPIFAWKFAVIEKQCWACSEVTKFYFLISSLPFVLLPLCIYTHICFYSFSYVNIIFMPAMLYFGGGRKTCWVGAFYLQTGKVSSVNNTLQYNWTILPFLVHVN